MKKILKPTRKYRRKPLVVEAYQTGEDMMINTLEGVMKATAGDYIVTGIEGEQYPCKEDIFLQIYEPVEEETGQGDEK